MLSWWEHTLDARKTHYNHFFFFLSWLQFSRLKSKYYFGKNKQHCFGHSNVMWPMKSVKLEERTQRNDQVVGCYLPTTKQQRLKAKLGPESSLRQLQQLCRRRLVKSLAVVSPAAALSDGAISRRHVTASIRLPASSRTEARRRRCTVDVLALLLVFIHQGGMELKVSPLEKCKIF